MDIGMYSTGTQLNRALDALGLPDKVGDMMGAALDMQMGNLAGAQRNLYDAYSGMKTKTLDRLQFGGALPSFGTMMPPFQAMNQALSLMGLGGGLGMSPFGPGGFSPGGMPFGGGLGLLGAGMFGGPGTNSLLLGDFMSRLSNGVAGALGGALSGLAFGGAGAAAGGVLGGVTGFLSGGSGLNPSGGSGSNPIGYGPGNYAGNNVDSILNDRSLSIEDKMALVLMTLASRKEKELEGKLDEMRRNQSSSGGGAGGAGGMGAGGLGGLLGGLGQLFGMGGGGPIGGLLGGVGQLLGGLGGPGGPGDAGGPGGAGGQQKSEQILSQELQMIQQKMQRLLETLSNIMKSFHDTSMASINNIR